MPPAPIDAGEGPSAAPANPTTTARVRRRARKRDGPPQLQFLTATDPSQFKDETAKRSVRSQAMIHYRAKAEQQKRKGKEPSRGSPVEQAPPAAERITPIVTSGAPYENRQHTLMSQMLDETQEQQYLYPTTSAAWWGTYPDEGFGESSWHPARAAPLPATQSSRYRRALSVVPLNRAAHQRVLEYEDSDAHEDTQVRVLVGKLATANNIGDGVDPFTVMPQFKNPELNSVYLVRNCTRAFVSQSTNLRWVPAMLAHEHILLSSTLLASTWMDMHAGCSGDSKRTTLVKQEAIGWINERLRSADTQFDNSTLMVILHLLAGEMWSCNEKTLRIHESGVARLITQRGGMHRLGGNGAMAEVAAACCYHCDVFCEATPLPLFLDWEPLQYGPVENSAAIPESPLFCPRSEFFTIVKDRNCSEYTYELLCDMRELTDLFIAHNASLNRVRDAESEGESPTLGTSMLGYDLKVSKIRERLASLPSAYTPGLQTSNDWVYESCRIAALIYTSAIIMGVPFSVAAEPGRNPIVCGPASLTNSAAGGHLLSTRLTEALYDVLEKSNTENVWTDMAGVLYWVALVGAAAARTPASINMSQPPRSRSEAYATWVRRCLIMFATRGMIILIFQHPIPVLMAQKRMLKVQELIGSGSMRRLVS